MGYILYMVINTKTIEFKASKKLVWTRHAKEKLRFYQLSENRIKRVLHHPKRTEKGIAENTIASCQVAGSKKHPYEIWVMYYDFKSKGEPQRRIISCWRYPGISPVGESLPIPEDILQELKNLKTP